MSACSEPGDLTPAKREELAYVIGERSDQIAVTGGSLADELASGGRITHQDLAALEGALEDLAQALAEVRRRRE